VFTTPAAVWAALQALDGLRLCSLGTGDACQLCVWGMGPPGEDISRHCRTLLFHGLRPLVSGGMQGGFGAVVMLVCWLIHSLAVPHAVGLCPLYVATPSPPH
jgi:hypothetical protein